MLMNALAGPTRLAVALALMAMMMNMMGGIGGRSGGEHR